MGQILPFLGIGGGSKVAAAGLGAKAAGAAFPSAANVPLLGTVASSAPAAKGLSAASFLKGAAALAPSALSLAGGRGKAPGRPKEIRVDREAAEAADRERAKRAREAQRSTILTGPSGAVGSALTRRTVLSGG